MDHETEALYTSATFYPSSHATPMKPIQTKRTVAEDEWLQEAFADDNQPSLYPETTKERFDWRLRASSRTPKPTIPPYGTFIRGKYPPRKQPSTQPVSRGDKLYAAVSAYEDRFKRLLEAEQQEAEAALKERLSTWGLDRLKEEGYCLTNLSAYWLQENQFGRPVAAFALGPGLVLPDHRFENGTQVLVSRIDPVAENDTLIKGSVVSSTTSQLKISFMDVTDGVDEGEWRLDVGHSDIIYQRLRAAVSHIHDDPNLHEEKSHLVPQPTLVGTHLRDVLLRTFEHSSSDPYPHVPLQDPNEVSYVSHETLEHPYGAASTDSNWCGAFKDDMRIQSWVRRYARHDPLVIEGDPIIPLNSTQLRAVAMMIGQRMSLIQGPPGTGKTKTIIEAVKLLKVHFEVPHPILVCTYTNVAVDNLVEGFVQSDVKPLRVGSGGSVRSSVAEHTLDHRMSIHPLGPELQAIMKAIETATHKYDALKERIREKSKTTNARSLKMVENMVKSLLASEAHLGTLRKRKYALNQYILKDCLSDADVICTTCLTTACMALKAIDFPVVFLDEASMSTEPASLVPIMKGSRHVALIGDHKQLPPVITSPEAEALGLGLSLFERLTQEGVVPSIMLDTQYRMHPAISRFPSSEFYDRALQDGTVDVEGNAHAQLSPPTSQHLRRDESGNRPSVIFMDHAGVESLKERSRVNYHEAQIVASIVEDLLLHNPQLMGHDIGIIAPYVAQISLLTRLFTRDAKYRARFIEVLGEHRAMQLANVEIKTVDGFEGREKEVIIFSTVRNNPSGYIGFLADRRRLNVGLTRARRGLFVVGNITTLQTARRTASERERESIAGAAHRGHAKVGKNAGAASWRRYMAYLAEHGLVVKLEGQALKEALYGNLHAVKAAKTAMAA
ncbi:hypothetical protein H0H93_015616 [Arthromyces matolae]|nr:hypothetical protein H0H93_015616 [Arthromyces matolae]